MTAISFGDNVRVKPSELTDKLGVGGKIGCVYGFTTPSVTGVEVIGGLNSDHAFNVHFEELDKELWFAPDLLEFVDHAPGMTVNIGRVTGVRTAAGNWKVSHRPWWKFWS